MPSETNRQLVRFLIIGIFNTGIGFGTILFLTLVVQPPYWISNAGGYGVGLAFGYFSTRIWTFRVSYEKRQALKYLLSFAVSYLLQLILLFVLIEEIGITDIYAQFLSVFAYTILNFTLQKRYVFPKRELY